MNMRTDAFSTKDFNEAALLISQDLPLIRVEREGTVCHFVFGDFSRAAGLTEALWRGNVSVSLRKFISAQRIVKDLIHQRNGHAIQPEPFKRH